MRFLRQLLAIAALSAVSIGAFAQESQIRQMRVRDGQLMAEFTIAPFVTIDPQIDVHPTREVNVRIVAQHADGTIFYDNSIHNLRTNGGGDWQANAMGATSSQPAAANYIALTNDSTAPAAGDCASGSTTCTLPSEIVTNGCARAQGTFGHVNGNTTWTLTHAWTASGAQSVQKAGMFNASSSGTMVFEAAFSVVTLANTDTLTVTWTVSI